MNLTDRAKFRVELLRVLLPLICMDLKKLEDEIEDCTPEELEALQRAIQLANELDDEISRVLESVMKRKGGAKEEWERRPKLRLRWKP